MPDIKYCYPNTNVLKNKLNIIDKSDLFKAERELTFIRLQELIQKPIKGKFNFDHLMKIHKYIFQDLYDWAGKCRTVDIGKGNLFCTVQCLQSYGKVVFENYYPQCKMNANNYEDFIKVLSNNFADLNALHPFREGNGRTQREFTRLVCLDCGYILDFSNVKQEDMITASVLSFNKGDNHLLNNIFQHSVIPIHEYTKSKYDILLTSKGIPKSHKADEFEYYDKNNYPKVTLYNVIYKEKIKQMQSNNIIEKTKFLIKNGQNPIIQSNTKIR